MIDLVANFFVNPHQQFSSLAILKADYQLFFDAKRGLKIFKNAGFSRTSVAHSGHACNFLNTI